MSTDSQLGAAVAYRAAGLGVIPARHRDKRPALRTWRRYQREIASHADLRDWFDGEQPHNIAIVCGGVSGNLAVLDFDAMATYERWAAGHLDLAAIAPTVATSRGRHVYLRTREPICTTKTADSEIRSEGAYCIAPQSIHPSGRVYRLLAGDFGSIPVLDSIPFTTRQADAGRHIACVRTIEDAIAATLPTGPGQRNRAVFDLAQLLKGMTELDTTPGNLRRIVSEWFSRCRHVVRTQEFSATWTDFVVAWGRIKHSHSGRWAEIVRRASAAPDPPESLIYDDTSLRRLAALCHALHEHHRGGQFPLSARLAADFLDIGKTVAANLLMVLVFDKLIEVVTPYVKGTRLAIEYRWLGGEGRP